MAPGEAGCLILLRWKQIGMYTKYKSLLVIALAVGALSGGVE